MVDFNEISPRDLQRLLEMKGKRGADAISVLSKLYPVLNSVFNSEIGREILTQELNDFDNLLEKIVEEKASTNELAEFRVLRRRIRQYAEQVRTYLSHVDQIKKVLSEQQIS